MSAEPTGGIFLEELDARRIGGLRGVRLSFGDGFNLVHGRNEAGKSTLRALVSFVLFGEIPSYLEASEPQGSAVLRVGGRKLFIERGLERGRGARPNRRLLIEEELGIAGSRYRSELAPADQGDAWLVRLLGGLTAGVFSDFYSIGLEQMIASNTKNSDVARRIQEASVSGGGKSPTELADQLKAKANGLWPARAAEPGSINAMLKELEEVRSDLRVAELDANRYESLVAQREATRQVIVSIEAELRDLDARSRELALAEQLAGVLERRSERQRILVPLSTDVEVPVDAESDVSAAFDALATAEEVRAKVLERLEQAREYRAKVDPAGSISELEQRISALDRRREGVDRATADLERAERQAVSAEERAAELQAALGVTRSEPIGGNELAALSEAARLAAVVSRTRGEAGTLEGEQEMHTESLTRSRQSYSQALGRMGGFVSPAISALSEPARDEAYVELAEEVDAARRVAGDGARLDREISATRREAEVYAARVGAAGPRMLGGIAIALLLFAAVAVLVDKGGTGALALAGAALVVAIVAVVVLLRSRPGAGAQRGAGVNLEELLANRRELETALSLRLPSFGDFAVAQMELTGINENAGRLREVAADCHSHQQALAEIGHRLAELGARSREAEARLTELCSGLADPGTLLGGNPEALPSILGDLRWQLTSLDTARASAQAARSEIGSFAADTRELAVEAGISADGDPIELLDRLLGRMADARNAAAAVEGLEAELLATGVEAARDKVAEIHDLYGIADRGAWREYLTRRSTRLGLERELRGIGEEEAALRAALEETTSGRELVAAVEAGSELEEMRRAIEERGAELTAGLSSSNQELGGLDQKIRDLGVDSRMAEANGRAEALRADIARTFGDWAAFAIAEKMLREGISRFGQERSRGAAEAASELFAELTNGRYPTLELGAAEPWVRRADGVELKLESLSRGTLDLAYLATRFAVAEVSLLDTPQGALGMPLLLDDVLVNHDRERARQVVRLLLRMAARKQVIFMTCHEHLVTLVQEESGTMGDNPPTILELGA